MPEEPTESFDELESLAQQYITLRINGKFDDAERLLDKNPGIAEVARGYEKLIPARTTKYCPGMRLYDDRYVLIERLGCGGQAEVWKATDTSESRDVALKIFNQTAIYGEFLDRELKILRATTHPHIVKILAAHLDGIPPMYSMELMDGNLCSLRSTWDPTESQIVEAIKPVADALILCHRKGAIHRDLKPANLLYKRSGNRLHISLADFGLARPIIDGTLTSTGTLKGTFDYMAPEQFLEGATTQSDVWAFGGVLFWLSTNQAPLLAALEYSGKKPKSIAERIAAAVTELPRLTSAKKFCPATHPDLKRIISKCMASDPVDRYRNMDDVRSDLANFTRGLPLIAGTRSPIRATVKYIRANKAKLALLALSLAIIFGVVLREKKYSRDYAQQNRSLLRQKGATNAQKDVAEQRAKELALQVEATAYERELATQAHVNPLRLEADRFGKDGDYSRQELTLKSIHRVKPAIDTQLQLAIRPRDTTEIVVRHDGPITAILESLEDNLLISAGMDARLLVTNTSTDKLVTECEKGQWSKEQLKHLVRWEDETDTETDVYTSLAWLDKGKTFVGAMMSGRILTWTIDGTKSQIANIGVAPYCLTVSHDQSHVMVAGSDGGIYRINLAAGDWDQWAKTKSAPSALEFLLDGSLAVGTANGQLLLFNEDGIKTWSSNESGPIQRIISLGDAETVVVASAAATPIVYRTSPDRLIDRRELRTSISRPAAQDDSVIDISVSRDGRFVLGAMASGYLLKWDIGSGVLQRSMSENYQTAAVENWSKIPVVFQCRYRLGEPFTEGPILYGAFDGTVKRWMSFDAVAPRILKLDKGSVIAADGLSDHYLWEGRTNGAVRIWNLRKGTIECETTWASSPIKSIRSTVTGATLVAHQSGEVRIVARQETRIVDLSAYSHPGEILAAAISPDAQSFAVVGTNNVLSIIDASRPTSGKMLELPSTEKSGYRFVQYDTSGATLIVAGPVGKTLLVSAATGKILCRRPNAGLGKNGATTLSSLSGFPTPFVVGDSRGGVLCVNELRSHHACEDFSGPIAAVLGAKSTQLQPRLVVCDETGVVNFFTTDFQAKRPVYQLKSPISSVQDPVNNVVVSKHCMFLVMTHRSGRTVIWDTQTETPSTDVTTIWREQSIEFRSSKGMLFPAKCAVPFENGMFAGTVARPNLENRFEIVLCLWSQDGSLSRELTLGSVDTDPNHSRDQIVEGIAICKHGPQFVIAARDNLKDWGSQIQLWHVAIDAARPSQVWQKTHKTISAPLNSCFHPFIVPGANHDVEILHFSHSGHFAYVTKTNGGESRSTKLGRKGTAFWLSCHMSERDRWAVYLSVPHGKGCLPLSVAQLDNDYQPIASEMIARSPRCTSFASTLHKDLHVFDINSSASGPELEWIQVSRDFNSKALNIRREVLFKLDPTAEWSCVSAITLNTGALAVVYQGWKSDQERIYYCARQVNGAWHNEAIGRTSGHPRWSQVFDSDNRLTLVIPPSADGNPGRMFVADLP